MTLSWLLDHMTILLIFMLSQRDIEEFQYVKVLPVTSLKSIGRLIHCSYKLIVALGNVCFLKLPLVNCSLQGRRNLPIFHGLLGHVSLHQNVLASGRSTQTKPILMVLMSISKPMSSLPEMILV